MLRNMYPNNFDGYSLDDLLQIIDNLNQTDGIRQGHLSVLQARSLLANLATVRASLDQTIHYIDETIDVLSTI